MLIPRGTRTLLTLCAAALFAGCSTSDRDKVEKGGIFALWSPPSPTEAARMMADPFDADKRYKGVTWISNAPWGGADVYLRGYRELLTNEKEDPGVRAVAARALSFHGTPEDALLITPLLTSEDRRVRQTAARALQRIHNPAVIPHLAPMIDTTGWVTISTASFPTEQAAAQARATLAAANPATFDEAFATLARTSSRDRFASAGGATGENSLADLKVAPNVFAAALRLPEGAISPPVQTPDGYTLVMVGKRRTETDHDTRQAAAAALGMYSDPAVLAALVSAMNDDDLAVSRTARQSLRILTGTDQGEDPKAWQQWISGNTAPFAGQAKYLYPNYWRAKYWWEFIPFFPGPINDPAATPIGYRPPGA